MSAWESGSHTRTQRHRPSSSSSSCRPLQPHAPAAALALTGVVRGGAASCLARMIQPASATWLARSSGEGARGLPQPAMVTWRAGGGRAGMG